MILFIVFLLPPISLWKKTPLWLCTPVSIFFHCRNIDYNDLPKVTVNGNVLAFQSILLPLILFLQVAVGDGVLGRRTGSFWTTVLRILILSALFFLNWCIIHFRID